MGQIKVYLDGYAGFVMISNIYYSSQILLMTAMLESFVKVIFLNDSFYTCMVPRVAKVDAR